MDSSQPASVATGWAKATTGNNSNITHNINNRSCDIPFSSLNRVASARATRMSSPEDRVRQPQCEHRHEDDDAKNDQQQDQERQDPADRFSHRRRRDRGEYEQIEADRRMDQADLHVVGEDDREMQ